MQTARWRRVWVAVDTTTNFLTFLSGRFLPRRHVFMDSATPSCSSKKEKDNFARLCWVLIEVGSFVLTEIFNKVCPPEELDKVLKKDTNHRKLVSLRKKRVLTTDQWSKLYPALKSSSVSSRDFDTSLKLLLLRSIFGLNLPTSGQDNFPPATDTSPVAGLTWIKVLRDRIHHHDTSGSVDDLTFGSYWSDIKKIFVRFGGCRCLDTINNLEVKCLDEDLAEDYQKQLKEWLRDDASTKYKLGEGKTVKKARKDEDMEGLIDISVQISGRKELELCQHTHGGAAENTKISPPELSIYFTKISDLPEKCSDWVNVKLPVDIALFTVDEVVFSSCFTYLKNPIKSYNKGTGIVYFSSMEDEQGNKIKITLMRCFKDHDGPGGVLSAAKDAISLLKPKALFFVGTCSGLKRPTIKLGDVVLSSAVTTRKYKIPPKTNIMRIINYIPDGWKDPLQNPNGYEAKIHVGSILSVPEINKDIIRQSQCTDSEAIGVDKDSGGFHTAAHASDVEWLMVMGIESFANDIQSSNNNWKKIASVRAASVVAKILSDQLIFQDWPHSNAVPSPCSATTTASASKPLCT